MEGRQSVHMPAVSVVYSSKARKGAGSARCAADYRTIWLHNSWHPTSYSERWWLCSCFIGCTGKWSAPPTPLATWPEL